jgi:peptidoglycan/LPS O-acetylase OafA/YrhL
MATYYPVIVTIAIFLALVFDDILIESPEKIPITTLQGFICVGLMLILSFKDMELVSWGLLFLPTVVLIICYYFGLAANKTTDSTPAPTMSLPTLATTAATAATVPAPITISKPASTATKVTGNIFTPITQCSR